MKLIKICFISLKSYPLFIKRSKKYFGGAELQVSLMAKELAKDNKYKVCLIVGNYGQQELVNKNKIKIYKTTINPVYFLKQLRLINADVYVERTANPKVFLVGLFCKAFKKKFIYMIAHDDDVKNKWLYWFGLRYADLVIAQTKFQQRNLLKKFTLKSLVIPSLSMPIEKEKNLKRKFILWVGRADEWKQPLIFVRLAKKLPNEKFVMVCRQGNNKQLFKKIKNQAEKLTNLKLITAVPIIKINSWFKKAKALVNTSTAEGFPNTFLQAGITNTPVVSLKVNPDNYLTKYYCGFVAENSFNKLVKNTSLLSKNSLKAKKLSNNHFIYVNRNHSLKKIELIKKQIEYIA